MSEIDDSGLYRRVSVVFEVVLVVLITFIVWGSAAFVADYVHDDHPAVLDNANVTWPPPVGRIFRTSYFGPGKKFAHMPLSRPLVTLSFAVEEGLGWTSSTARHLVGVAFFALICALIGAIFGHLASAWAGASTAAWETWWATSGLVFAFHPIHASAIMSVAYRPELMALCFVLMATLLLLQIIDGAPQTALRSVAGGTCFGLALLCKESAICALAPWLVAAWMRPGGLRRSAPMALFCALCALALLGWRHLALGGVLVAGIPWADNPLSITDGPGRILGAMEGVWLATTHLMVPLHILQAPDWSFDALPVSSSLSWRAVAGVAISMAGVVAIVWGLTGARRQGRGGLIALGLVWVAAFYLPASNLLFPIPVRFAERLLFAPSVAACALIAWPLVRVEQRFNGMIARLEAAGWPRWRRRVVGFFGPHMIALFLLLFQALFAATPWCDDESLFEWGVAQQPRSAKMQYNLGRLLVAEHRETEALPHLQIAVALRPDDQEARITLLEAHFRLKQCMESRAMADAMEADPKLPPLGHVALYHWAGVCRDAERMRRHEPWLRKRVRGPPTKP